MDGAERSAARGHRWQPRADLGRILCRPVGAQLPSFAAHIQGDHMTEIHGTVAPKFEKVRDAVPEELRRGQGDRRRVLCVPPRREGGRPLGRHRQRRHGRRVGRGHAHSRVLDHQGRSRGVRQQAGPRGSARRRCTGGRVLARVRSERERNPSCQLPAVPSGRPGVDRRRDDPRGSAVVGPSGRRPGRAGSLVGTRVATRLSRHHLRMVGRRSHSPDNRQERRHLLP